ncbi:hypothetical protein IQ225_18220 [Synechocystis salina LEGE 06155]|nr:hypothetical protein [Synechocystis salina LEGE 06155]
MGSDHKILLDATRLRLRMKSPFFATLSLFAQSQFTRAVPTAATDGQTIYLNPDFFQPLSSAQKDGLFLHELLHAALLHGQRRGSRQSDIWNIAADIVVNGMIVAEQGYELPEGGIRDEKLEKYQVEEVYELLLSQAELPSLAMPDLLERPPVLSQAEGDEEEQSDTDSGGGTAGNSNSNSTTDRQDNSQSPVGQRPKISEQEETSNSIPISSSLTSPGHQQKDLEVYWRNAIKQATVVALSQGQGTLPAGIERHLGKIGEPQLDWRHYLWRFLVHTPNDFQGFDRRFIHQGLYLDYLTGESVEIFCCIDTSGSIDDRQMSIFLGEVRGILGAYPQLQCWLWYADADCYGPYEINRLEDVPKPEGGGGTDFRPFFQAVEKQRTSHRQGVICYLTDGYGSFPSQTPSLDTLWVVIPGGLDSEDFPFGEVVRLQLARV